MNIKILFDHTARVEYFKTGWGFSCLIDDQILFDTGANGHHLINNMKALGTDFRAIRTIVISHNHWDHRDGLWEVLKENPRVSVYLGATFSKSFRKRIESYGASALHANLFSPIAPNMETTGDLPARVWFANMPEQSLIVSTHRGLLVITGCAHPGITNVLETITSHVKDKIHLVLGGFHLIGKSSKALAEVIRHFKDLDIEKVAPCHCSGKKAFEMFREAYGADCLDVKVGDTVTV